MSHERIEILRKGPKIFFMTYPEMPHISCSTGTFYHLPLTTTLALIRDAGYTGAEFVVSPESLIRGMSYIERVTSQSRLPILTVHPPLFRFPGWPRSRLGAMVSVVSHARELGAKIGVIHAPKGYSLESTRVRQYCHALTVAQKLGKQHDIEIGLETTQRPIRKRPMILDDLERFLQFADTYQISVTLDTCHAAANRDNLVSVLNLIGSRLRNIHLSDAAFIPGRRKPKTHLLPGTGNLADLHLFIKTLAQTRYAGVITLELSPFVVGLWPPSTILSHLNSAREFVVEAWQSGLERQGTTKA
jgi:sugar phosphate isomerase/epimerase